jgi:hypothetical protein
MKSKVFLGLIAIVIIISLALIGCDNGTTTDNGTAPTLTEVIVANSTTNAASWTSANTFVKNVDIYVGVKVDDPDADIVKVWYVVKQSDGSPTALTGEIDFSYAPLPASFTGAALIIEMSKATEEIQDAAVGAGYTIELYFIDAKGNKSETRTSNVFEITAGS